MTRLVAAALLGGVLLATYPSGRSEARSADVQPVPAWGTETHVQAAPGAAALAAAAHDPASRTAFEPATAPRIDGVVAQYCQRCHNERRLAGDLSLVGFELDRAAEVAEISERMIRKLRAGMMPPPGARRPGGDTLQALAAALEQNVDREAVGQRRPGTRPFQRVNRAEYARLVRDVLGLQVDPSEWLPADQISASFDNIADVQAVSPTLMNAYLTAASEVARAAVGQRDAPVSSKTYQNPPSVSQHEWEPVEGAPFGTRGGISAMHVFPADGEYAFSMGFMSGWGERGHDIDISIDGARVALLRYGGDIDFQGRKDFPIESEPVFVRAGQRRVTAAFIRKMDGPYEDLIRPNDWSLTGTETSYGTTSLPHLMSLTVEGPHDPVGVSDNPSRRRIFSCRPTQPSEEQPCATEIVSRLAASAYGRALDDDDVSDLMGFYRMGADEGGFEMGVRTALEAILVSPHFLFRTEREPRGVRPGEVYEIDDRDLAARLSFFLWGTQPDQQLLALARAGELSDEGVLEAQTRRLLADPRSEALATRFASLWLRLQDLDHVQPDAFWFPNYSRQITDAMRRETELFFDDMVRSDRSLLELFRADYTFVNERLARHYGIPGVLGEEFRRVTYPSAERRGVLGHGSVLVQTSLGNRTSPVLRGKWVMEVLLGTPPPPPPPGVPDLEETAEVEEGRVLTTRERLEMHRANPQCTSCHRFMDPIGLALDNFDVTGTWRIREQGAPVDTRGTFYDGTEIETPADLSRVLLKRPTPLVRNFTQNLMAYALGRRIGYRDQPAIREIEREAERDEYRMTSLILGVVKSDAFRFKEASAAVETMSDAREPASSRRDDAAPAATRRDSR